MPPALAPLTVEDHIEAAVQPGRAALAMGLAALEPHRDATGLFDEMPGIEGASTGLIALEALKRGPHVTLYGTPEEDEVLDRALTAGLRHRREAAGIRHVLAAADAGHPALVLVDRKALHEASPSGPHWILTLQAAEHEVTYHDPLLEEGPTTIEAEALPDAMGIGHQRLMLELAPATRIDR